MIDKAKRSVVSEWVCDICLINYREASFLKKYIDEIANLSDSDVILAKESSSLPLFNLETSTLSEIYFKSVKKKNVMIASVA